MKRAALCLILPLALGGCAALPMIIPAVAGAVSIAKDVIGIDVSIRQNTPGKVPLARALDLTAAPPPPADPAPLRCISSC